MSRLRTEKKPISHTFSREEEHSLTESIDNNSHSWIYWVFPPFLLSLITALFYYPSLTYNFQFDDVANIQKFFNIRFLTFREAFFSGTRWIPFWLNAVNYRLGQFKPFYYRLFNVSFHIVAGILVFYLIFLGLSQLKKQSFFKKYAFSIACCTAVLFMLHPVQTQTVSYVIQGRLEGLASLFVIAMSVCLLLVSQAKSLYTKIIVSLLLLTLGFFSCGTKEIAIVSPIILLIVDWFFIAQGDWQSLKKRIILHSIVSLLIFGIYLYFFKPSFFIDLFGLKMQSRNNIGNVLTEDPTQKILPLHFFISQFKVILHYIFMFVWPFTISVEYDWKMVAHFFAADCILPLIALGIILFFIAHLLRKDSSNLIAFGALWFFIAIAPRSSIIPSSELLADYKTYLASVGVLFILACGIIKLIAEAQLSVEKYVFSLSHRHVQTAAVLLLAIPMGSLTYKRNKVWRTPEDFWSNIIENAPGKARAYNNLGVALSEQGKIQEAIPLYKKAITMDNHYPDPHNNLAVAYSMVGKMDLAIDTLKHAIRIHPYYPEAYNNLASFYIARKDFDQAEKLLNFALQMRPYYGKAYYNLGKIYIEKGNFEKALECFRTACTKADLDTEAGYQVYANAAINLKRYDEAIFAVRRLLSFNPSSLDLQQKLAQIYLWNKNYEESIMLYQHLIKAQPNNNLFWFNLGECFLHLKNPEKALDCYTQARNLKLNIPHLPLRMIACLEQMGQLDQAKVLLNQYIKNESVPADLKNAAKASLARLEQYQTIQTSSAHFDQKAV